MHEAVGNGKVIGGLSGGVDSSVAAILIHAALKDSGTDQLTCVFVDHGLLRLNERQPVEALFRDHYNIPQVVVDAEERFVSVLARVGDPSTKGMYLRHKMDKRQRGKE